MVAKKQKFVLNIYHKNEQKEFEYVSNEAIFSLEKSKEHFSGDLKI